jgi:tetratricopeptide (TPR) repeat protein
MPLPEDIATPKERQLLDNLLSTMMTKDPSAALPALDAALSQLREPTRLRGAVQLWRAGLLVEADDFSKAAEAVEESIRLLPGYSAPLLSAASVYAYANQPGKAADYFLRAAEADPETARMVDDYEVNNIIRRLKVAREERRLNAFSDRLLEIGWIGSSLSSQSTLAASAIERRVRDKDLQGARSLIPKLLVPDDSYMLLTVNELSPVWRDIEQWTGPKLERQWTIYLNEARARWAASKAVSAVRDYSAALEAAGHYDTVIRDLLPMFSGKLDKVADYDLVFVVPRIARALAQKGRWRDVDALFERTQKVWPLGSEANAINIAGNRARYLLLAGRHQEALQHMDAAIAEGRRWEVNPDALASMHHFRACILHELGRDAEAAVSMAVALAVEFPPEAASLHLCMGNDQAARRILIDALADPASRKGVIDFVQKQPKVPMPSEFARRLDSRFEALKADRLLLAEVAKYGRVLPFRANEGAPPEANSPGAVPNKPPSH